MVTLVKGKTVSVELSAETDDAPAVRVDITPIGQHHIDLALGAISVSIAKLSDDGATLERYGYASTSDSGEVLQAASRVGNAMLAIELGIRHIKAWEGVELVTGEDAETGAPVAVSAPVETAMIALLFNTWAPANGTDPMESYGSRFMRRINAMALAKADAKKGSGASPDGNTGVAPNTAKAAAN